MTNCLTFALRFALMTQGGRIGIIKWGRPFPHFGVFFGPWVVHYSDTRGTADTWWKQLNYDGEMVVDWVGEE